MLSLGDAEAFSVPGAAGQGQQLLSTMRVLDRYTVVLAVRGFKGQAFMRRDRRWSIAQPRL